MERIDNLMQAVGRLEGSVSTGFQAVHRRLEDQERSASEWRRHFMTVIRHVDNRKRPNGGTNGKGIYAKAATVIGLLILGTLGHVAPEALRAAIAKLLLSQVGG